jgi:hypothetical protein
MASELESVGKKIYFIRGYQVMLDRDLAELYGVLNGNLNKAVTRNLDRFPLGFMFLLSIEEVENLKFQFGTSSSNHGGHRKPPGAFTQEGIAMLSGVLKSERAV